MCLTVFTYIADCASCCMYCRCVQLLQDCQILSPKGVTTEELSARLDLLLRTFATHIDDTGLLCALLEFIALVADRKALKERCTRNEDNELIPLVGRALEQHRAEKSIQRAGLQLYEAILLNASEKSQKVFAKKIFRAVGENLQKNNDDPAICYTSYSILCTLCDKMGDKLAPWVERILGLVLTTITQLYSAELVAKCLLLLEKLAVDHDSLFVMAAHPRCLRVFTDALGVLDTRYMSATITALEYLLRILEDETAMSVVVENLKDQNLVTLEYFQTIQNELGAKSDKFLDLAAQEGHLDDDAMRYWLQLLEAINNVIVEYMTELRREMTQESQAAITPGLLPTIHEHSEEDGGDSDFEEESVTEYDEDRDVGTGTPKNRKKRKSSNNVRKSASGSAQSLVPESTPLGAAVSADSADVAQESLASAGVAVLPSAEPASIDAQDGTAEAAVLAAEAEAKLLEQEEERAIEEAARNAAAAQEADEQRRAAEAEEEVRQIEEAIAAEEAEAERLALEQREAAKQAELAAREAAEAEAVRVAQEAAKAAATARAAEEEEEAKRAAQAEEEARQVAAAEAAARERQAAEAEAQRVAQEAAAERQRKLEAEAVRQAALAAEAEAAKAAAAAKAEEEARCAAQAAEEARVAREAELAAARVRAAEETAAREREAAEAAAREAEAREKAAADAAEAERVERGRVAAAIAAAEKKRAEQLAETQRQKEREEAARKAASEKAEKERASVAAEAERRAREAEENAQRTAAQQAERHRLAGAERAETERLMALRDAAIRKAAEEEAERARLAAEQAEGDRRAAQAEAEAQRLAEEKAEAQRLMALRDAAVRRAEEEEADRQRLLLEATAEATRLAELAEQAAADEAARLQAEREETARQEAAAAERLREAESAALTRRREEVAAEAARLAAAEKQRAAEAEERERVAREEAEALRLRLLQEREEEERRAEAQRLEEARLAAEQAEAELAAEEERWRLEEERAAEERLAAVERAEAERLAAEERAAAESLAEEQRVAKLAAERAAARVAAEKEAQRQRAAEQAAELAARQAAAEAAKAAALEKRNARLAAEKAAREEAEERRLAQERERADRLEEARAARAAAAQQALADARERAEREAEAREQQKRAEAELAAAQEAADADVFALASTVSTPPASESEASPGGVADAVLHTSVPSNGSAHSSILGAIEAERDVSPPPPPPPPLATAVTVAVAPAAPSQLTRNDSWRTAQVPFHRSSAQKWGPLGSSLAQIKQVHAPDYLFSACFNTGGVVLSCAFQPNIRAATAQPPRSPSVAFDTSADTNQKPRKSPTTAPTASARSPASRTSPATAPKSAQGRATSPSPVKSALHRTPTSTSSRRSLHTPHSAAAGHLRAMDSVHLDLATPLPQTAKGQHSSREHTATTGRRASAASTGGSLRAYSVPKATHIQAEAQTATASAQHPHQGGLGASLRSSSTGRSVTFARAKSPLDLTRDDSDPVPPLTEEEVQRRAARAERLQRIHYPHLHRSPGRGKVLPTGEESAAARQQAAVDGLLEAFAQLSVPSTSSISGLNMGTAVGRVPHSSLRARSTTPETARIPAASPPPSQRSRTLHSTRSGRFLSPQRDGTPSRRGLAEMERLYNEVVAAAHKPMVQRCGENLAILFRRLKETNQNSSSKNNDDSVISTALTKGCIKKLGLVEGNVFHASDAEILLSRLGVKSLTVFGFALALTLCAERALCSEENSLDALGFTDKAASFRIGSSFYRGSGDAAGPIVSSYLNVVDYLSRKIDVLFRKMDAEHVRKSAFNPLDEYREITPEQQLEVVTLLEREKKVFFTIYESYLPGTKRAFADIKSALTVAPLSGGLPFSGVVSFCRDFELSPELLSRPQLLEVFNSILLAEKALVLRRTAVDGTGSEVDGDVVEGPRSAKKQNVTPSSAAKKGGLRQEPPLSDSISFPQVMRLLDVILRACVLFCKVPKARVRLSRAMSA
jgi:hypothetical protein